MNPRTHIVARRFWARLQQRRAHQAMMAALTEKVLERYAAEVRTACPEQLAHLAERAESLPDSTVCAEMRALVQAELITRNTDEATRLGWNANAHRIQRWEAANRDGDWRDPQYDEPGPDGGAR